ncbi:MAG: hypothetical protein HQL42_18850 [Alphaproteobacteria bacterium]|nr:hypothetical protein [Alphaproteobacteria bacterium]
MDTLDEDEIDRFIAARPVGIDEAPPSRPIRWRRLVMVLLILVLGGGLGTVGYFVSNMDTRDVIAALDVADRPQLSIQLPGRDGPGPDGKPPEPAPSGPTNPGGLLTPPGGVAALPPPSPGARIRGLGRRRNGATIPANESHQRLAGISTPSL